jgi:hypothetical protein
MEPFKKKVMYGAASWTQTKVDIGRITTKSTDGKTKMKNKKQKT